MQVSRRGFLGTLVGGIAIAASQDPFKLWVPGAKKIFIPKAIVSPHGSRWGWIVTGWDAERWREVGHWECYGDGPVPDSVDLVFHGIDPNIPMLVGKEIFQAVGDTLSIKNRRIYRLPSS